jgi:class 3 adenylate cyclase
MVDDDSPAPSLARPKNLDTPDEVVRFPGYTEYIVEIGDLTVARVIQEPGWVYSRNMATVEEGPWCEAHHVGVTVSGRHGAVLRDGSKLEYGPDDVYDIPPGHDGYTIGDEPAVMIEWSGPRTFGGRTSSRNRVLTTLLFTDVVGSTETVARIGDSAWRDLLSRHFESNRAVLERHGGRELETTGDGMLVMFSAPASAVRCAEDLRAAAVKEGLHVRIGVHVGEVELVAGRVRGMAVHEAARVMATADADQILVSETVRAFAAESGLTFEEVGEYDLKGLPSPRRLFSFAPESTPSGGGGDDRSQLAESRGEAASLSQDAHPNSGADLG